MLVMLHSMNMGHLQLNPEQLRPLPSPSSRILYILLALFRSCDRPGPSTSLTMPLHHAIRSLGVAGECEGVETRVIRSSIGIRSYRPCQWLPRSIRRGEQTLWLDDTDSLSTQDMLQRLLDIHLFLAHWSCQRALLRLCRRRLEYRKIGRRGEMRFEEDQLGQDGAACPCQPRNWSALAGDSLG